MDFQRLADQMKKISEEAEAKQKDKVLEWVGPLFDHTWKIIDRLEKRVEALESLDRIKKRHERWDDAGETGITLK